MDAVRGAVEVSGDYAGQGIALLTQHGKERIIASVLEPALGCVIQRVSGFDTDQLGSFTREIPRPGSQLDAARRKARIGMELAGLPVGMGSEGSFVPDPFTGMFGWNIELVVLIDERRALEIVGSAQGTGRCGHIQTGDWSELESFARREGFPDHHLVLRPRDQHGPALHKGIHDWDALRSHFETCLAQASNRQVFAETDLRAHANPTRMRQIGEATQDLLRRLQSCCPQCGRPGYWVSAHIAGLPCEACGLPTQIYRAEVWECASCKHTETRPRVDKTSASPQHCAYCNP